MSRITIEDEYTLIIVDVPVTEERNNRTYYVTIPLGDYHHRGDHYHYLFGTITASRCLYQPTIAEFLYLYAFAFIFQILYRNAELYLTALRSIDRKSEQIESQLHQSTRNEELIELMELKKPSSTSRPPLKTNERVIKKLTSATSNIKKYLEDEDLLGRYLD